MRKIIKAQFIILLCGTLFAWGNFIYELIDWINKKSCTLGCVGNAKNPFLTPCFFGAIFFTISFILSVIILKKSTSHGTSNSKNNTKI